MTLKKVYLEITNVCNLACPFCIGHHRPSHFLTEEEFLTIVLKIRPYTEYVYLHLMGEPLLHPALPRFLDILYDHGLHGAITTNGLQLGEAEEALLRAPLYKISISLHAWEANFGAVMTEEARLHFRRCLTFAKQASENGTITALRLWNEDRADRSAQNTMNAQIVEMAHDIFPEEWSETHRGARLSPRCYLENEAIFDWPDNEAPRTAGRIRCMGLRDQIGILCDGTIVPCCLDHDGGIALGNIFTDDVSEILSSKRACAIREGFLRGEAVEELCRRCGYAAKG